MLIGARTAMLCPIRVCRQAEQSHQQQLDELERATRANEAFLYKETEQKLARVRIWPGPNVLNAMENQSFC